MSRADILTVTTLAAHLALHSTYQAMGDVKTRGPKCASDAMLLQKLGRRARNNAGKRWIHPENRDTREEIQPYLDECARIDRELKRILEPYGLGREAVVCRDGVIIRGLPGNALGGTTDGFQI